MGISVQVSGDRGLEDIRRAVEKLADGSLQTELLESIGAVVESQTRRRIIDEKSSPGGERWADWSDGYKKTRHGNQSLLRSHGDLLESIRYIVARRQVRIGSPLEHARIMNDGFSGSVTVSSHKRLVSQCFGRALKYPVWQTVGSHNRVMDIPQREFLGLSSADQQELQQVISHFWKEVLP